MSVTKNWKFYLLIAVVALLAAFFVVGCGQGQRMMDSSIIGPESGQSTRATKPVVQDVSFLGKRQATVNVIKVITETDQQAFGGHEYFIQFSRAISGRKITWDWAGNFGVDGKATIEIVSHQNVSGYYRTRLVSFSETNEVGLIAEWANIPVNGGQTINLVLPYGQQARVIYDLVPNVPPDRPGINLLFPKGGEIIPQGPRNIRIDWEVENYKLLTSAAVNIELVKDGVVLGNRGPFLLYDDPTFWNFSWEVGTYYDAMGMQKAPPGNGYRIRVTIYNNDPELSLDKSKTINGGFAESGDFTISVPLPTLSKG